MKRYIRSAEQPTVEDKLNDQIGQLKDDFNFLIEGIEKIAADGDFGSAQEIASGLSEMINASIDEMAESISAE
jgi:methyl-accepting chemotaxis protein